MSQPPADLPAQQLPLAETPRAARPRLSIAHLMLWTLGTAIVLAFSRAQIAMLEPARTSIDNFVEADALGTVQKVTAIAVSPFTGLAVALLIAVAWRLVRRGPLLLVQPGHWLLLIAGVTFLKNVAVQLAGYGVMRALMVDERIELMLSFRSIVDAMGSAAIAALYLIAWERTAQPPRWRVYFLAGSAVFWLVAIGTLLILATNFVEQGQSALMVTIAVLGVPLVIVFLVSFPWAVGRDIWNKQRRDMLHWAGVIVVVATVLAAVANSVIPILFLR